MGIFDVQILFTDGNCPTCDCITNEPSTPIVQTSPRPIKEESNVTSNSNQDQSSLSTLSSRPVNDSQEILATTSVSPNLETTLREFAHLD